MNWRPSPPWSGARCAARCARRAVPGGAALDQVHGDLGARVADADDEDVTAGVGGGVAVVAGVQEFAGVRVAAGPLGQARGVVVAGGDDHGAAGQLAAAGGVQQPAVATRGGLDARDLDARDDLQLVLGVLLQVAHHVVARDPPPEGARHREAGQAGQPPGPCGRCSRS